MAVDLRPQLLLRIVNMHSSQIMETDNLVKTTARIRKTLLALDIVASGQSMCRIHANTNPALVLYLVNDMGDLLERMSEVCSLTGSILDHGADTRGLFQSPVD